MSETASYIPPEVVKRAEKKATKLSPRAGAIVLSVSTMFSGCGENSENCEPVPATPRVEITSPAPSPEITPEETLGIVFPEETTTLAPERTLPPTPTTPSETTTPSGGGIGAIGGEDGLSNKVGEYFTDEKMDEVITKGFETFESAQEKGEEWLYNTIDWFAEIFSKVPTETGRKILVKRFSSWLANVWDGTVDLGHRAWDSIEPYKDLFVETWNNTRAKNTQGENEKDQFTQPTEQNEEDVSSDIQNPVSGLIEKGKELWEGIRG